MLRRRNDNSRYSTFSSGKVSHMLRALLITAPQKKNINTSRARYIWQDRESRSWWGCKSHLGNKNKVIHKGNNSNMWAQHKELHCAVPGRPAPPSTAGRRPGAECHWCSGSLDLFLCCTAVPPACACWWAEKQQQPTSELSSAACTLSQTVISAGTACNFSPQHN